VRRHGQRFTTDGCAEQAAEGEQEQRQGKGFFVVVEAALLAQAQQTEGQRQTEQGGARPGAPAHQGGEPQAVFDGADRHGKRDQRRQQHRQEG